MFTYDKADVWSCVGGRRSEEGSHWGSLSTWWDGVAAILEATCVDGHILTDGSTGDGALFTLPMKIRRSVHTGSADGK